ncbi:hypothetical protein BS78_04G076100 [Paspalum vaginatum]|nr:hypothetical protein BS78_04G076100 [Paspalum vaginatum]
MTDEDEDGSHSDGELRRSLFSPSSLNPAKRLRAAARRMLFRGGAGELHGVLVNMESVSSDLAEFIALLQCCPPALHRPLATNLYADCQMFGRHLERRRLGVLPIIGRAGLGKTTLVQHVCDEPAVRHRFSLIMMVDFRCISLTVASETAQLLRSLFTVPSTATTTSVAGAGEQFLAVFDNVDPRKKQVMEAIMPALRRSRRGSRIIVTGSGQARGPAAGGREAIAERLRGSLFFGAKVVGTLLRSRPDHRLWRRLLAACHANSPLLGNGGYVSAVAGSLLPPHMTVLGVAVSGSPVRGLVGLQDATFTAHVRDGGSGRSELPVLLCKSIFPSYCLYYTAYCTIDRESRL